MRTNLPLPQLTYGSELEELKTLEAMRGLVTISQPQALSESLPRPAPAAILRPIERAFSAFSATDFLLLVFCLATGRGGEPRLRAKAQHDAHDFIQPEVFRLGGRDRRGSWF